MTCCEDFDALVEGGVIEQDREEGRSRGWFRREKYVMLCRSETEICNNDIYIIFCPRCGKKIVNDFET